MPKFRVMFVLIFLVAIVASGSVTYAGSRALQPEIPTISASGVIEYDTGSAHLPAEGLLVQLYDEDARFSGPGEELASDITDEFGRYSFEDVENWDYEGSPPRWDRTGQDLRLLISTDNDHVAVQEYPGGNAYRWASDAADLLGARGFRRDVPDGEHVEFPKILFKDGVRNFQAIRAFVAMNHGWSFVVNDMGLPDPGRTVAEWPTLTVSERGYHPEDQTVVLTSGDADFPDAVLHFQAHALMDNLLRDLGGEYPTECVTEGPIVVETNQTCAWIHGWGLFFAAAVQDDPVYVTASQNLNLESPSVDSDVDLDDGDAVTARVAGALWDLLDATNEGFDGYTGTFTELWDTIAGTAVYTFREFWDASDVPACEALPSLFQNTIDYNTPPELDPFPDPATMDEDQEDPLTFDMRTRARDAECAFVDLVIDIEEPIEDVTIELDEEGMLHVIPAQDFCGELTVNIRVFDGIDYAVQPLHIVVSCINDAPRIAPPPDRTVKVGEDIVYQLGSRISDPDHALEDLTLSVVAAQGEMIPRLEWDVDAENFIVTFMPRMESGEVDLRPGTNAVDIVVTDPEGATAQYRLLLTWEPLPNQPPAIASTIPEVWEAHKGQTIPVNLLPYATDDRDEPEELSWSVDPETLNNATVSGTGTQTLIFTPDPAHYVGDDDITLVVQDRDGRESTVEAILRWTPEPNIAPTINPPIPNFNAGINQKLVVDLSPYGHDQDDNDAGLRWYVRFADSDAQNPFVAGQGTQRLTFTPLVDFEGTIEATFVVRDPKGAEAEQLVSLTWQRYNTYMPLIMRPFTQKPTN